MPKSLTNEQTDTSEIRMMNSSRKSSKKLTNFPVYGTGCATPPPPSALEQDVSTVRALSSYCTQGFFPFFLYGITLGFHHLTTFASALMQSHNGSIHSPHSMRKIIMKEWKKSVKFHLQETRYEDCSAKRNTLVSASSYELDTRTH